MNHETENTLRQGQSLELDIMKKTTWHKRLAVLFTSDRWELIVAVISFHSLIQCGPKNCTFILLSVKERFEGEKKAASIISLQSVRCRVAYVLHKTVLITTDINITAIPMTI